VGARATFSSIFAFTTFSAGFSSAFSLLSV